MQHIANRSASAYGIAIITISSNQKKILKQATLTDDYWLIKYEPDKILFSSASINPNETWGIAKERKTYWIMDNNGDVIEEVKDYQPPDYSNGNKFSNEIKSILPEPYSKYNSIYAATLINNWVIIYANNGNQYNELFIMDKTNPNSLRKIGDGYSIAW